MPLAQALAVIDGAYRIPTWPYICATVQAVYKYPEIGEDIASSATEGLCRPNHDL